VWPVNPHPAPSGLQVYGSPRSYAGGHKGSDYGVGTGTAVLAISNGVVDLSDYNGVEGNFVTVLHDNGIKTHSIHLSSRSVTPGQRVSAGQQLGLSGNTGSASEGAHLHIEVYLNRTNRTDPHAFFLQYVGPGNDNQGDTDLTPEQDSRLKNIEAILAIDSGGGIRAAVNSNIATTKNLESIIAVDNGGGIRAVVNKARDNAQAALDVAKNVEYILATEASGGIRATINAIRTKVFS
jgi:murein DD-endopeptidase MepM/ murein hydrolase activator NlpD